MAQVFAKEFRADIMRRFKCFALSVDSRQHCRTGKGVCPVEDGGNSGARKFDRLLCGSDCRTSALLKMNGTDVLSGNEAMRRAMTSAGAGKQTGRR